MLSKNCIVFVRPGVRPDAADVVAETLASPLSTDRTDDSLAASEMLLLRLSSGLGRGVMYFDAPSGGQSLRSPRSLLPLKRCDAEGKRESSLYGCCQE